MSNLKVYLAIFVLVIGCAKEREPHFSEELKTHTYDKKMIEDSEVTIHLEDKNSLTTDNELSAESQINRYKVVSVSGHPALKPMFKDLWVEGKPGAKYNVRFRINKEYLVAFKIIDLKNIGELSVQESSLSIEAQGGKAKLVPLFQYPIEKFGTVTRKLNDLDEKTREMEFRETEFEKASHLYFSMVTTNREKVGLHGLEQKDKETLFVKAKIHGKIFSGEDLERKLRLPTKLRSAKFHIKVGSDDRLGLFEITTYERLSQSQKRIISQSRGGDELRKCPREIQNQVQVKNCVLVLRFYSKISHVTLEKKIIDQEQETFSWQAVIKKAEDPRKAGLIQIETRPQLTEVLAIEQRSIYDPKKSLVLSDFKDKEFLLRRTISDSPNIFDYTFAGSSSGLEIVRFIFEADRVKVVRSKPLLDKDGSTDVDLEVLMSMQASYKRLVEVDTHGNPLPVPGWVNSTHDDENAVAYIDWSQNTVPNTASALDFYSLEKCFAGKVEREILEVDQNLGQGLLSFTLATTYVASSNPNFDCAGVTRSGYFDRTQKSFTFKERVAFKVYDKGKEDPNLDVPYEAQKRLGFGLFTYNKTKPNELGRTDVDGTRVYLPSVFDINGGKKIHYVLAGIPADNKELQRKLIKATKEVIDDLNDGMRKALKGTPKERNDQVITLSIEEGEGLDLDYIKKLGLTVSPKRQLGDLDRNYIYYVAKGTKSGVIGLGGSHANGRSGRVEAASVFLYGGNILGMVDSLRKIEKAQKDFRTNMKIPESDEELGLNTELEDPQAPTGPIMGALPKTPPQESNQKGIQILKTNDIAYIQDYMHDHKSEARTHDFHKIQESIRGRMGKRTLDLYQKFREAIETKAYTSEHRLASIFQKDRKDESKLADVIERLREKNFCVYEADAAVVGDVKGSLDKKSNIDILIDVWKPTLAHEIGHNLGLRHNFQGSFDKKNWKFTKDEKTKRNYSSIMDYLTDDHYTYDGLGPYDIHALRVAYANVLEIDPAHLEKAKELKAKVYNKRFINPNDYLKAIGLDSWLKLSKDSMNKLKLKPYDFCSDEEAGQMPTCNRFDSGTTPEEIVDHVINEYRTRYSLNNFAGDKLNFTRFNTGRYIGKLFSNFLIARQFLEESFFQLIYEKEEINKVMPYLLAAYKGYQFFQTVIRTPDAPLTDDEKRFRTTVVTQLNDEGQQVKVPVRVELKRLRDEAYDDVSDRLRVRGIEFDKLVAMIMLKTESFGFPRYTNKSLRLSYPLFEKLVLQVDNHQKSPLLNLLYEVLNDEITPAVVSLDGSSVYLSNANDPFKVTTSESIRNFALIGAIVDLDIQGFDVSDNPSRAFRVLSDFNQPESIPYVTTPGQKGDLLYWSLSGATMSNALVSAGDEIRRLRKRRVDTKIKELKILKDEQLLLDLKKKELEAREGELSDEEKVLLEQINKRLTELNQKLPGAIADLDEILKDFPYAPGRVLNVEIIENFTMGHLSDILQNLPKYTEIEKFNKSRELEMITKNIPILGIAFEAMDLTRLGIPEDTASEVSGLLPLRVVENREVTLFNNVQTLSSIFQVLHPEYR